MLRAALYCTALAALAACAAPGPMQPPLSRDELLSAATVFGALPQNQLLSPDDVFGIDEEMRSFVRLLTEDMTSPQVKLSKLLNGMEERGLFALDYATDETLTVRETFDERRGNCLSFTMLFVVLAREAGLRATYQMVDVPPAWSSDADLLVLTNHINAVIKTPVGPHYTVDFNITEFKGHYDSHEVSDNYALALFYSNLGVEALVNKDHATSFLYLKAAIDTYPEISGAWVNLGLLYSRRGLYERAESAYLHALAENPRNRSAMTNLAGLYTTTGNEQLADAYRKRVRHYQQRNPYYHYALAYAAYQEQRFADALELLDGAIRLKGNEHQFYFLEGLTHEALGQKRNAEHSFLRAKKHAELGELKEQYDSRIQALAQRL
jgi:tetratricopeptide (TPR) repeat protein